MEESVVIPVIQQGTQDLPTVLSSALPGLASTMPIAIGPFDTDLPYDTIDVTDVGELQANTALKNNIVDTLVNVIFTTVQPSTTKIVTTTTATATSVKPTPVPSQVYMIPSNVGVDEVNAILSQLPPSGDVTVFIGPIPIVKNANTESIPDVTQEQLDTVPKDVKLSEIISSLADEVDITAATIVPFINQENPALADMLLASKGVATNPVQLEEIVPVEPSFTVPKVETVDEVIAETVVNTVNNNKPAAVFLPASFSPPEIVDALEELEITGLVDVYVGDEKVFASAPLDEVTEDRVILVNPQDLTQPAATAIVNNISPDFTVIPILPEAELEIIEEAISEQAVENTVIAVNLDKSDNITAAVETANTEIADQPLDSVVIIMPEESTIEEIQAELRISIFTKISIVTKISIFDQLWIQHIIDEFSPKAENLTIAFGDKIVPAGTAVIDEDILAAIPVVPDIVQSIIDSEPAVVIPIVTKSNTADLIAFQDIALPVVPVFAGAPIVEHIQPIKDMLQNLVSDFVKTHYSPNNGLIFVLDCKHTVCYIPHN